MKTQGQLDLAVVDAIRQNSIPKFKRALEAGGAPQQPVSSALNFGNLPMIKAVFEAIGKPGEQHSYHGNLLCAALADWEGLEDRTSNPHAVLDYLLEKGVDPFFKDKNHLSVRHYAAAYSNKEAIRRIAEATRSDGSLDLEPVTLAGKTPLFIAIVHKNYEAVKALIELGANVNHRSNDGSRPLHQVEGGVVILETLIDAGARHDVRNATGGMPIHAAIAARWPNLSAMMMRAGAVLDKDSGQLEAALELAVKEQSVELLKECRKQGADVAAYRDPKGQGLLHVAFLNDDAEMTMALLEMGCDPDAKSQAKRTATSQAWRAPECMKVLKAFNARRTAHDMLDEIDGSPATRVKALRVRQR